MATVVNNLAVISNIFKRRMKMAKQKSKLFLNADWYKLFLIGASITLAFFVLDMIFVSTFLYIITRILIFSSATIAILGILTELKHANTTLNKNTQIAHYTSDILKRSLEELSAINHDIKLNEQVKSIAYRDINRLTIGEAILARLHQKDFSTTYEMIEEIESKTDYANLAETLRKAADKYKNASESERIQQVVAHIENLAKNLHWDQAALQAERLAIQHPDTASLTELPAKIRKMKEQKKTQLLKDWEKATNSGDTDRSLRILKELDKYLTPSEAQALEESVSGVFRTKLHNLGVSFSLAVSQSNWETALETGEEIIRDYPNSKMAHEILSKIEVLRERAK